MRWTVVLILAVWISSTHAANTPPECEKYFDDLDQINSQLRNKHTNSTGNRLKKEKRRVKEELRLCKKQYG